MILPEESKILRELCEYVSQNLLAENVSVNPDTLLTHVGIDSYSVIEIILFIERKYEVIIPENMLTQSHLETIRSIAACTLQVASEA